MAVLATKIFHFLYIILGASIGLVHCGTISHHLFLQMLRPHDSSVEDSINTQNQCPFVCTVENQCGFGPPLLSLIISVTESLECLISELWPRPLELVPRAVNASFLVGPCLTESALQRVTGQIQQEKAVLPSQLSSCGACLWLFQDCVPWSKWIDVSELSS